MQKIMMSLFAALLTIAAQAEAVTGKVRPQKLNARIQPVANAGIVDKLDRGSEVKIVAAEGAWYKIELPKTADAYVSAEYLKDGKTITRVQMRYGAGVEFHSYGVIAGDTAVEVLSDKNPIWTKIAPPTGFFAYVSSPHVAVSDADYRKLTGREDAVAPSNLSPEEVAVVKPASMEETGKRFERMRAWFTGSPEDVTISGEVLKTDSAATGAAHVLAKRAEDGKITVIAVLYDGKVDWSNWSDLSKRSAIDVQAADLSKYIGKNTKITGKKLTVPSWAYPYIVVEKAE